MKATLTRAGNLVGLSLDGATELPRKLRSSIEPQLTYTYQKRLYGLDRIDPVTGESRDMLLEERKLYKYDSQNRLCFCVGFLQKVAGILKELGYTYTLLDLDPPRS